MLIAVSGGVDSMNLLHFLYLFQDKLKIRIGIAHVNHKQRSESDSEEAYLKCWAKNMTYLFMFLILKEYFQKKQHVIGAMLFKSIMLKITIQL